MQELIKITTDGQGSKVVSARELYEYLEVKTEFAKWCGRMFEYGFVENHDYSLVKIGERSFHNKIDYALTIDTAKEIAMLQRTEKGKQARQYFIECEKALKAAIKPMTPAELALHQAQLLVTIERRQQELDERLRVVEENQHQAMQLLLQVERSTETVPEETTRAKIRRLINQYCTAKNADHRSVWHVVYDRLYYRYGISMRAIVKKKGESALDVAERLGHLDKIYAICSSELTY